MTFSVSPLITDVRKSPSPSLGVGGFQSPDLKLFIDVFDVDESCDRTDGAGLGSRRGEGDAPGELSGARFCTSLA